MREEARFVGGLLFWLIIVLIVIAIISAGAFYWNAYFYPKWLGVQRNAVENSKSYVDSTNSAMMTYIQQYEALPDSPQRTAVMNDLCQLYSTMKPDTVRPLIASFVAEHGGCR